MNIKLGLVILATTFGHYIYVASVQFDHEGMCGNTRFKPALMEECLCGTLPGGDIVTINCTNRNINDTALGKAMPATLQSLTFVGNDIRQLHDNIFGTETYNKLLYIDFSHNNIEGISGKAFHKVKSVEELNLSFNRWNPVREYRVFSNFENLKFLHLTSSFLPSTNTTDKHLRILRQIFKNSSLLKLEMLNLSENDFFAIPLDFTQYLPNLKVLHLEKNDLFSINLNSNYTQNLEEIYLQENYIRSLDQYALKQLLQMPKLRKLVLNGNKWACDCHLEDTIKFLKDNASWRFIDEDQRMEMTCTQPDRLKGQRIDALRLEDLDRCYEYGNMNNRLRTSYIIMGVVFGIIGVLFVVIMFMNRKSFKLKIIQYSEPVRDIMFGHGSSRGYSSVNI